jgi:hypothetical protein
MVPMVSLRWSLSLDLLTANVLVWLGAWGRDGELTRDTHLYFFERYTDLADYHRRRGNARKADRFRAKAEAHRVEDDGPPYAAAMAMPHPRRFVRTNAVGRRGWRDPDDAA